VDPGADVAATSDPQGGSAPADPPALAKVIDYLTAWGVEPDAAAVVARSLDSRVGPDVQDAPARSAAMLEAFEQWTEELAPTIAPPAEPHRVAFVMATLGPRLLTDHPDALDHPAQMRAEFERLMRVWEHGVLPTLPQREMHRQPLGKLPAVLRGEFWSGTYRWVMPSAERALRKTAKSVAASASDAPAAETPDPSNPAPSAAS
jgi:hypothetical protein